MPAPARRTVSLAVATAGLSAAYVRWVRPWALTWGATADEARARMPGDGLIDRPPLSVTRALTVGAPPEAVWPWLVQAGTGRAGWYSYDLVDNLGRRSADRILPQWQGLAVGDLVPLTPSGRLGLRVHSMAAPGAMVWGSPGETTWEWQLHAVRGADGSPSTRLVTRFRSASVAGFPTWPVALPLELGDAVMMRKMLLTIKGRVERAGRL
ncbi:hypothetical protein V3N99_10885 [Dermatophilaceae bacterium Soc4.6]